MRKPNEEFDLKSHLINGIWESEHQQRFKKIGDELDKVRKYANERNTDADMFSQAIVWLTISSYFAGLIPITRIESALFLMKDFKNEYVYALITRSYIEISARLHKGITLLEKYLDKKKSLEEFHQGVGRLLATYHRQGEPAKGIFKEVISLDGKLKGGFNVLTLIDSLEIDLPGTREVYDTLSTYVHGDFGANIMNRKNAWISSTTSAANSVILDYEKDVIALRNFVFEDFDVLMMVTRQLRERYDDIHKEEKS